MFHNHLASRKLSLGCFIHRLAIYFNISLDLGYLTKHRTYTFFKPEWVIYAVYFSEKIGYWRYILMYRHLEKHR